MEKLGQAAIETIPAPVAPVQAESQGVGVVGYGIGVIILAVIGLGLYKNYQNNKK
tara:strand:- start:1465 stop:1629 length:165 start_codon:yes stop_codon:yes gene_type:complete